MPDTSLILHVKGTEAETAVLPKAAVREGVSKGTITHSQLIWIPTENTWKPVKELPELLSTESATVAASEPPVERLILHVKGTEAETQELPKPEVKAAISQGKITHSQLIWIPNEHTWKPVRELPDLMPGETLILHVKGTESETQVLPKQEVQAGVSKGQITHSQLIWIPSENSWKPVRELPDLLPGERLILHVKGTEAETKELPKRAIRTALAKGEITHSQLIWSPHEHAWKQVRELPELLPSQKLAPAPARDVVPKVAENIIPESPTGPVARAVAASGDIPQVRVATASGGVPRVRVATEAGAAPKPRVVAVAPPKVSVLREGASAPKVRVAAVAEDAAKAPVAETAPAAEVPRVHAAAADAPQARVAATADDVPQVRVAAQDAPQVRASSSSVPQGRVSAGPTTIRAASPVKVPKPASLKVHEEDHAHPLKWFCIGLGVLIVLIVGGNFLLVDQPLTWSLSETPYSNVTVYAHLGAYIQPNVLVIHIRPSTAITPENLTDFLVALAHSTPDSPLTRDVYARIAITAGWTAQYSFSGYSWKQLGEMKNDSEDQRREFIMTQMGDAAGQSLLPESTLNADAQQSTRDMVWGAFVAHFTSAR